MGVSLKYLSFDSDCLHDRTKQDVKAARDFILKLYKIRILTKRKSSIPTSHVLQTQRISKLCVCCCERHNSTTKPGEFNLV